MIFEKNKYTSWYNQLVIAAKSQERSKKDEYFESHHIVPKSLGGSDEDDNLILLTPREHFIAHLLLTKMVDDTQSRIKMEWALHRVAFSSVPTSRLYDTARRRWVKFLKENHHAHRIKGWGEKMSQLVFENWRGNETRRSSMSSKMKKSWSENREARTASAIANLPKPKSGKDSPVIREIEYNGKVYYGWSELEKETKVSRFLYNKYYRNGIDPTLRIGKDGPNPGRKHTEETRRKMSENHRSKRKEASVG